MAPLSEVLKGEGGITAPQDEDDSFAQATLTLTRDRDRRREMGVVARSLVEQYHSVSELVGV